MSHLRNLEKQGRGICISASSPPLSFFIAPFAATVIVYQAPFPCAPSQISQCSTNIPSFVLLPPAATFNIGVI